MHEQTLFTEALEKDDPAEREVYLDRACAGDSALRQRIAKLLQRHQQADSFLDSPIAPQADTIAEPPLVRERPGAIIGPYKLVRQIGEGGMGLVFVAEQERPVRRRVALKVIKPGMDTREVIARFEAERQTLAVVDHPNIARVLDAGTTESGRPYFVMELVDGCSITEYCDQKQLTPTERLELFVHVCHAVQHAHQKGIIHRDLKPSNVLVTLHDGKAVVKVIDFGIAKAIGQHPTEKSILTHVNQLVGTPLYMSPEQAGGGGPDVDTRSDIYSLGVLLYELLTGRTPFDKERLRRANYDEIRRIIREEEPPKPRLRSELDWIVMKALEKDRTRRYETASDFAADVQRYLNDEPVHACPPSAAYRLRKLVRRNTGWAAAILVSALSGVSLIVAVIATLAGDANEQRRRADEAERQSLMRESQTWRFNSAQLGWSANAWSLIGQAARIRVDAPLRNEAIACMMGLDAIRAMEFKHEGACALAFDSTGTRLILGAQRKTNANSVWRAAKPIRIWHKPTDQVRETKIYGLGPVAFDAADRPLALTTQDRALVLWDLDKEQPLREFTLPPRGNGNIAEWALSTDGTTIAARAELGDARSLIVVWNATTGKIVRELPKSKTSMLALSADGGHLAAGDRDGRIEIWSLEKDQPPTSLKAGPLQITALAFGVNPRKGPDAHALTLASGNQGGTIVLWDLADKSPRVQCRGSSYDIKALEFSPDGTTLVSAGRMAPRVWDAVTGNLLLELEYHDFASAISFTSDGRFLAISNADSPFSSLAVRLWELQNGRGVQSYRGLEAPIAVVEFSADGSRLAALSHLWEIAVFDVKTSKLLRVFQAPAGIISDNAAIALSDDNQTLAFAAGSKAVLWDLKSGELMKAWDLPAGMSDQLAYHAAMGKFLSFRTESVDDKAWPRVGRLRELTSTEVREIGVSKGFNLGIVRAGMARDARVLAVAGFNDEPGGETRQTRIFTLPDLKELWREPADARNRSAGNLPLDPAGQFFFAQTKPLHLVNIQTGKTEPWPYHPICLGPNANFAIDSYQEAVRGHVAGLRLHRRDDKSPLFSLPTNVSDDYCFQFNRMGTQFVWGTSAGTLFVCDIAAVKRRLAEHGLEW